MNIKVKGGKALSGEVTPSGSKNSAVACIPASILFKGKIVLENIPDITDVGKLINILEKLNSKINWDKENCRIEIDNSDLELKNLKPEELGKIRGTAVLWGPILARFGKISFEGLPGGCTLGYRTLEPHYQVLEDLGVNIKQRGTNIEMHMGNKRDSDIWLKEMSPTATENAIMYSCLKGGKTKLVGAASEPQVQDLCNLLIKAGAKIDGVGSSIINIEGVDDLGFVSHKLLSDHYEIATYIALSSATNGTVRVQNALPEIFKQIAWYFSKFGIEILYEGDTAIVDSSRKIQICEDPEKGYLSIKAQPWPGLPVDILPLFIPLALAAKKGQVLFHNWMYDSGLFWTDQLVKLGANLTMCDPHRVLVTAGAKLKAAEMNAPYIIRATVALLMAALIAEGESTIYNADALYRGHPDFSNKLRHLGLDIKEL